MLLTDPFLQLPGETSVRVIWFTEIESRENAVLLYENGADKPCTRKISAKTTKLSRMRGGKTQEDFNDASIRRQIWRHEATVEDLPLYHGNSGERIPYRVMSDQAVSGQFLLQAKAQPGTPMKILLTSDMQVKDMCAANYQKVYETVGGVDAVWANGDVVNVADRAYDWFYAANAFFRVLQGRASFAIAGREYRGAALIQNAPTYAAVGNHEIMGPYKGDGELNVQFDGANGAIPQNFNTDSWEEIMSLPQSEKGGKRYYAVTIGDVRLIVLEVVNLWRSPITGRRGKYSEEPGADPKDYGFGQFIFEPVTPGSDQYCFLQEELAREEFRKAKYKIVMFHWQHHSLGGNQIPPFTDPVASKVTDPITGKEMVLYDYPLAEDHIAKYIEPLLEQAGVRLVFNAHSHVWNHFCTEKGMHFLETSHVGNGYGAYYDTEERKKLPSALNPEDERHSLAGCWEKDNYVLKGDPYGLTPVMPSKAGLPGGKPYLSNATHTAFSILDTATGNVDSYYFDTTDPDSAVVKFDSFSVAE